MVPVLSIIWDSIYFYRVQLRMYSNNIKRPEQIHFLRDTIWAGWNLEMKTWLNKNCLPPCRVSNVPVTSGSANSNQYCTLKFSTWPHFSLRFKRKSPKIIGRFCCVTHSTCRYDWINHFFVGEFFVKKLHVCVATHLRYKFRLNFSSNAIVPIQRTEKRSGLNRCTIFGPIPQSIFRQQLQQSTQQFFGVVRNKSWYS